MSLCVAVAGKSWIALGADRGAWKVRADGTAHSPYVLDKPKFVHTSGIVASLTGRLYQEPLIEPVDGVTVRDKAQSLWDRLYRLHDPITRRRFADNGWGSPEEEIIVGATEETVQLGALKAFFAGFENGVPALFLGDYPIHQVERLNSVAGNPLFGFFAIGNNESLAGIPAWSDAATAAASIGVSRCRSLCEHADVAEQGRELRGLSRGIRGPFDFLLIEKDGVTKC